MSLVIRFLTEVVQEFVFDWVAATTQRPKSMAQIKVVHDPEHHTLMVFFGDPGGEVQSEAIDDQTVIFRDEHGNIIGVEKLEYDTSGVAVSVTVETHSSTQMP
ncbi:MAG: DUF2283 domain-containing protein [Planctomycetota bacterium]|nr:DUF2283 domain-containing protein [Planctomycetota bacterium]